MRMPRKEEVLAFFSSGERKIMGKWKIPNFLLTKVNKLTFRLCDLLFRLLALTCEQFEPK